MNTNKDASSAELSHSTMEGLRAETIRRLEKAGVDTDDSGSVLYTGWSTLCKGPIYLMGLNPGGKQETHASCTIRRSIEERGWKYSAYEDECWERNEHQK